jgi:hypothetical protein
MSQSSGKQIVIDACVASSCSSGEIFNPQPDHSGIHCRNCLMAIADGNHIAVFSPELAKEWDNHASRFARHWRAEMLLTDKVLLNVEVESFSILLDRALAVLTTEKESLTKDFHLIQSALASGQLIVSIESRFPQIVSVASMAVPEFTLLYYANPAVEGEVCIQWIKDGAEKDVSRRIDAWAEKHRGRN